MSTSEIPWSSLVMRSGWVRKVKGLQHRDSGVVTIYQNGEAVEEVSPQAWDRFIHDGGALAEREEIRRKPFGNPP
jgi:hypothetical protein